MRYYRATDMAKIDSIHCEGCGRCCRGMGDTIHVDPWDIYRLTAATGKPFRTLLEREMVLRIDSGMILPSLAMAGADETCAFLGADGRCSIHDARPGICRLFPLGREYDSEGFAYFIVPDGCDLPGKRSVRIHKYLGISDYRKYEKFVTRWHRFVKGMQERFTTRIEEEMAGRLAGRSAAGEPDACARAEEELTMPGSLAGPSAAGEPDACARAEEELTMPEDVRRANMRLLTIFYDRPYDHRRDFYSQFDARMAEVERLMMQ